MSSAEKVGVVRRIKLANSRGAPETSLYVRGAVLCASLVAAHAVLQQDVGGVALMIGVYVGIPAGHVYSHLTRARTGLWTKLAIAMAMMLAVTRFVSAIASIAGDASAVQVPLAELFLWTLLLHSWDVPTRRDLSFSLVSSLVLMGVAGTLSISLTFAWLLIAWTVPAFVAMLLMHDRELGELRAPGPPGTATAPVPARAVQARATVPVRRRVRTTALAIGAFVAVVATAGAAFMLLPSAGGVRAFTFPVSLPTVTRLATGDALVNPTLGDEVVERVGGADVRSGKGTGQRTSFGYFGFARELDTGTRGRPDDTLVMRVRASAPAFWRGQSFDTWDGRTWTSTLGDPETLPASSLPIDLQPPRTTDEFLGDRFTQTYYVVKPGPNMIFAASTPSELYFADDRVYQMDDGSLRAGVLLEKGTVYTVVSQRPAVTPERLRELQGSPTANLGATEKRRYLQLPDTTSARTRELAAQITQGLTNTYDKVRALEAWLGANTTYSIDIPPLPDGVDAVDHFLFDERVGFCEQIGTSLVVMLRSIGVPARLTVGYAAGERNPFTGLYDVRASDAHAWAEVWVPRVGWLPFDPTANVPFADTGAARPRAGAGALSFLSGRLPSLPDWVVPLFAAVAAGLGVVVAGGGVLWLLRRRRTLGARPWVERWMSAFERAGARRGRPRAPTESARVYADALGLLDDPAWQEVVATIEREAFGRGASPPERERADAAVAELTRR